MRLIESLTASSWAGGLKPVRCIKAGCSRWLTQRHLAVRPVGVSFRDGWFCSYRCFASTAQQQFKELLPARRQHSKHSFRMPLGLSLVSKGWLTDEQYRTVSEQHRQTGADVAHLLTELGYVGEKQLTAVRAAQWGCPVYDVPANALPTGIHLPPTLMNMYSMVPLHHTSATDVLLVGFVHGIEYEALYAVEQVTGCKTRPCLITPSDYTSQMHAQHEAGASDDLIFDSPLTPAEMTRTLCDYGALLNANEAVIVRCGDYLWARLKGGRRGADLLFKAP